MKVILLEKIKRLGDLGEQVDVKPGYGRNFLIPNLKAVTATVKNQEYFNEKRKDFEELEDQRFTKASERAKTIDGQAVKIAAKVSDEGKLYGSLGVAEIVVALSQKGIEVEKQEILLDQGPIREIGEYLIKVALHHGEVKASVKVNVVGE